MSPLAPTSPTTPPTASANSSSSAACWARGRITPRERPARDRTAPGAIDEVIGIDGTLTHVCPFRSAPSYHVVGTPAALRFANGARSIAPDSGPVLP